MRPPPGSRLETAVRAAMAREDALRGGPPRPLGGPGNARSPRTAGKPSEALARAAASAQAGGKSRLVEDLVRRIEFAGLPAPRWAGSPGGEVLPIPGRRFRLDLAWEDALVYCEVDGGVWIAGRHGRGTGIRSDCEKTSLLAGLGWRGVRVEDRWIRRGLAVRWIAEALAWRPTRGASAEA